MASVLRQFQLSARIRVKGGGVEGSRSKVKGVSSGKCLHLHRDRETVAG